MRQTIITACIVLGIAAGSVGAVADNITLVNGVELRNVTIKSETDYVVTVDVIGMTRLILGKSEIADVTRRAVSPKPTLPSMKSTIPAVPAVPTKPAEVRPTAVQPAVAPAPPIATPSQPSDANIEQVLKVATEVPGTTMDFHVLIAPESGVTFTVKASTPPATSGSRMYTIKADDGTAIQVLLNWDNAGKVTQSVISPPEPPASSMQSVYDYTLVTVGGEKFKLRAIWDLVNRQLIDTKIVLL